MLALAAPQFWQPVSALSHDSSPRQRHHVLQTRAWAEDSGLERSHSPADAARSTRPWEPSPTPLPARARRGRAGREAAMAGPSAGSSHVMDGGADAELEQGPSYGRAALRRPRTRLPQGEPRRHRQSPRPAPLEVTSGTHGEAESQGASRARGRPAPWARAMAALGSPPWATAAAKAQSVTRPFINDAQRPPSPGFLWPCRRSVSLAGTLGRCTLSC